MTPTLIASTPSNKILYHYCSSDSFNSICQSKAIRLSDLHSMNDGLEIKWGYSIWEKTASILIQEMGLKFIDRVDEVLHHFGGRFLILSISFSTKADVLSQWRAYASDGHGYALGFKASDIFQLPVLPIKILYNERRQSKKMEALVREIYEQFVIAGKTFNSECVHLSGLLAAQLASMKNPSFEEEKEVRIIHLLDFQKSNKSLKLHDDGGRAFGNDVPGIGIKYRMRDHAPVAYQDYDFTNGGKINPIKEVILGPKNYSLPTGISVFLETLGIGNVNIKRSQSSYI